MVITFKGSERKPYRQMPAITRGGNALLAANAAALRQSLLHLQQNTAPEIQLTH
jgi:hypothetical protein